MLLATSAGAQVMAGTNGSVSPWVAGWLAGAVITALAAGLLGAPSGSRQVGFPTGLQKNLASIGL
ncbi:hypothetical protein [Actinokineospora inagensis]|uniref:hypothetical protein n=1 Tax=Actinokineospora inagensis TaxID=103730 RepID=UPI0012FB7A72|nr:hypothetical protein [Actinokineospora inagensis]